MRALVLLIWVGVGLAPTESQGAEFTPSSASERLLGRGGPKAAAVAAEVRAQGFYAGAPVGVGQCARCHPDVVVAWSGSAHRFASFNNPYYRVAFDIFKKDRGPEATGFCGGCHDPLLVSEGTLASMEPTRRETIEGPRAQAGITCLVCHSMHTPPDLKGNGEFTADVSPVPVKGPAHGRRVASPTLRSDAFCVSCHRVGLEPEITAGGWFRGQDEYGDWLDSRFGPGGVEVVWPAEGRRTCTSCHMPRVAASPRERGAKGGLIADHRALGANGALPHLRGDAAMVEATEGMLSGAASVDLQPGRGVAEGPVVDVVLHNRAVGHRLPGGTQDSNQVWLAVTAWGADGAALWRSGALDEGGTLDAGAHRVRAQPVDGEGDPIARRDAHRMRGVVYDTTLKPGLPKVARYHLPAGTRRVEARLLYRKFERRYLRLACEDLPPKTRARCESPPVYEIARAEGVIVGGVIGEVLQTPTDTRPPWARWVDHGLALADGVPDDALHALGPLSRAVGQSGEEVPRVALAKAMARLGRTDAVAALTAGAAGGGSAWVRAKALGRAYRTVPALAAAERALASHPGDRRALAMVARLRGVRGLTSSALAAADALLVREPESGQGWFHRMLALRALGDEVDAGAVDEAEARWLKHRRTDEIDLALRRKFRARWPAMAPMTQPIPTYGDGP